MGDFKASRDPADVLVSIGLGSCIGLAVVDGDRGVAGLAHILLPDSTDAKGSYSVGKFADTAVPALVDLVAALGAPRSALKAVLVGGAQMFSFGDVAGSTLDIGARNERATRAALERARLAVGAAATGGSTGRTIRVHVAEGTVTVKKAGGKEEVLAL
jgi:chemotaxis protein CheD